MKDLVDLVLCEPAPFLFGANGHFSVTDVYRDGTCRSKSHRFARRDVRSHARDRLPARSYAEPSRAVRGHLSGYGGECVITW